MRRAKRDSRSDAEKVLRVGVIDMDNARTAVWQWRISPQTAWNYLERLTVRYLTFLEKGNFSSGYVDFTYKKLAKAIEDAERYGTFHAGGGDWTDILERLTADEWHGHSGRNRFNNSLVVENAVEGYRRNPTATEIETLYAELYELPMSGVKEADGNGGAA